jgi:signal transduction histidine kinase
MEQDSEEGVIREKIYEELHSTVIGKLRGVGLRCAALLENPKATHSQVRQSLANVDPVLRDIIFEIRRVIAPPSLTGYISDSSKKLTQDRFMTHLLQDVKWYESARSLEVELVCYSRDLAYLDPTQFIQIQQIYKNWLDNIALYAKANKVSFELRTDDDRSPTFFILRITDDGIGNHELNNIQEFVKKLPQEYTGLRTIVKAAKKLCANLEINSSTVGGTTLVVKNIPVNKVHGL